ncbi:MAG: TrkH family potassium uptake protein [Candidatus Margulisiibacteriota bacterium]
MKTRIIDYFIGGIALFAFLLLFIEHGEYLLHYAKEIRIINYVILIIFICDFLARIAFSEDKWLFLKKNWLNFIVFIPLFQFIEGIENLPSAVFIRQIVIVFILISRTKKATNLINLLHFKPAQLMLSSFAFTIGIGTILLMLPAATISGAKTTLIDALFTATSAACVTGLIVQDTATHFSFFGKTVILALIQLGGLGIMTFSVSLALILKKNVDINKQVQMQDVLDQETLASTKDLTLFIIKMTFLIELIGAIILFFAWNNRFHDTFRTIYYAVFHSISAFCNAGFSTFSDSLMQFSTDSITNITISLLIILGGIGFLVIRDIFEKLRSKFILRNPRRFSLRVHTKIVLFTSILLTIAGGILIYVFESNYSFASFSPSGKALLSFFQSVTTRTAGFNSCNIGALAPASLLVIIILMFIGASPGSTGGGIKTTTFFVLWSAIVSGFKKRQNVEAYRRTIPLSVVQKASNLFVFSLAILSVFTVALLYVEKKVFIDILFEAVSAFGTVGLSTGITPLLTGKGKILITILMFIGRLGPLTIGYAFLTRRKQAKYFYAEERVIIG